MINALQKKINYWKKETLWTSFDDFRQQKIKVKSIQFFFDGGPSVFVVDEPLDINIIAFHYADVNPWEIQNP